MSNADTLCKIGHSILVGHDNAGVADHTLNDCGLSSVRSLDYTSGWSPVDFSNQNFHTMITGRLTLGNPGLKSIFMEHLS